jgi:hypothetical protein
VSCIERDFSVPVGETFHPVLRWGSGVYTSKAITGISKATPAVVTAVGHALPDGWPCAVVGAQGMTQINAHYPPRENEWEDGTVVDANNVALNAVSSAEYSTWTAGGALVYDTPVSLAGATVTMEFYTDPDRTGTPLVTLTSGVEIALDDTLKTITPTLQTEDLAWTTAYFRVDATVGTTVTELLRGVLTIE